MTGRWIIDGGLRLVDVFLLLLFFYDSHPPEGSDRVRWLSSRSKIKSSISRTFFRRHKFERNRKGFLRLLLMLVLLLLNDAEVAPDVVGIFVTKITRKVHFCFPRRFSVVQSSINQFGLLSAPAHWQTDDNTQLIILLRTDLLRSDHGQIDWTKERQKSTTEIIII